MTDSSRIDSTPWPSPLAQPPGTHRDRQRASEDGHGSHPNNVTVGTHKSNKAMPSGLLLARHTWQRTHWPPSNQTRRKGVGVGGCEITRAAHHKYSRPPHHASASLNQLSFKPLTAPHRPPRPAPNHPSVRGAVVGNADVWLESGGGSGGRGGGRS